VPLAIPCTAAIEQAATVRHADPADGPRFSGSGPPPPRGLPGPPRFWTGAGSPRHAQTGRWWSRHSARAA